ncbi:MAG: hypothetical protein ACRC6T_13160 [Sarcina sp.]
MDDRDMIIIMDEEYNIAETEELVQASSIVIDGPLKSVMDKILNNNINLECYNDLIKEALYRGLIEIINMEVNPMYKENCSENNVPERFDKTEYEEIPFEEFEALRGNCVRSEIEY